MAKWQESFSLLSRQKESEVRAPQLIDNVEKREKIPAFMMNHEVQITILKKQTILPDQFRDLY